MKKVWTKGFTLIELLVVIAVLGILAAVVLVAINPQARIQDARNSGVRSDIGQIGSALEAYFTENNGSYPTALTDLADDDQLKTIPLPAAERSNAGCGVTTAYGFTGSGGEVAAWADLEPCDSGTDQVWYVYWSACGRATELTQSGAPAATQVANGNGC